ncbi:MAG TPA: GNAT family N-acetyltransferase [Pirellulales bacterium]|jgi:hypothetical protein
MKHSLVESNAVTKITHGGQPSELEIGQMRNGHTTVFSTAEFINSWCRAFSECEPVAIQVHGSGQDRTMHVVREPVRYAASKISGPKPDDLWTSPGWSGELSRSTVEHILHQMQRGFRTRTLRWQVRFDHEPLARMLSSLGLVPDRVQIHVLKLDRAYGDLFENYSATTRNHVRKAARRGVSVRSTSDAKDILAYHSIYSKHAHNKGWGFAYPAQLTMDLVNMGEANACFKVAEYEGSVIGGALFLRDGNSIYYLHGVADREFSHLYPATSVMDAGIQWACESGAGYLNLGNSGVGSVNESLATFKSSWGAHVEQNWLFDWERPLWKFVSKLKSKVRSPKSTVLADPQ